MQPNILLAFFSVALFSLTAPFTRYAALEISAEEIICLRIVGAGFLCMVVAFRDRWIPPRSAWMGIVAASLGSVLGFNSFMAFGLKEVPSGHAAVALASLPMTTAIYSLMRDRRNPGFVFWVFALLSTFLSFGFLFFLNVEQLMKGDLYLLFAVLAAAFGYVEGGRMSRQYGGVRVMTWAVLITMPLALLWAYLHFYKDDHTLSFTPFTWVSLSYLAFVSQALGMFLWFRVLAKGPMEKIALVQLLQPFLTLIASSAIVGESVSLSTWVVSLFIAACVFVANNEKAKSA